MTSSIGGDVSYFRDVFPELAAMPDAVLAVRLERLRELEEVSRHLNWLEHRDESDGDPFDWLPSDG